MRSGGERADSGGPRGRGHRDGGQRRFARRLRTEGTSVRPDGRAATTGLPVGRLDPRAMAATPLSMVQSGGRCADRAVTVVRVEGVSGRGDSWS